MKKFGLGGSSKSPKTPRPKTLREVEEEIEAGGAAATAADNPAFEEETDGGGGKAKFGRRSSVKSEGAVSAAAVSAASATGKKRSPEDGDGKKELPWKTQPGTPGKARCCASADKSLNSKKAISLKKKGSNVSLPP